ncbi:unnamed protein product [Parnassius apollo]|uniref:(apollo) hypothetical protein n=1 Tax=Parnassius apollo TaxID=110799 RepID=A0A8S3XRQ4_PARAO|nr:unnamed protein product [Parnassius apollo]
MMIFSTTEVKLSDHSVKELKYKLNSKYPKRKEKTEVKSRITSQENIKYFHFMFCNDFECPRPLKDIEARLQSLLSSEGEDTGDDELNENFSDIVNKTLDRLQNIITEELLDIAGNKNEAPSHFSAELVTETDSESQLIQLEGLGIEGYNMGVL